MLVFAYRRCSHKLAYGLYRCCGPVVLWNWMCWMLASAVRPLVGRAHLTNDNGEWPIVWPVNEAFNKDGARLDKVLSLYVCFGYPWDACHVCGYCKTVSLARIWVTRICTVQTTISCTVFYPLGEYTDRRIWRWFWVLLIVLRDTVVTVRIDFPERLLLAFRQSVTDSIYDGLTIDGNI